MKTAKVSQKHLQYFEQTYALGQELSMNQLQVLFDSLPIFAKTNQARRSLIAGALAAGYYHQQGQVPMVKYMMSDDASEYKGVALQKHIHCWVHAIRHYRLLTPHDKYLRGIYTAFMEKLWAFYEKIKGYKYLPPNEQMISKKTITNEFDQLFGTTTDYEKLNKQMALTREKRAYLLAFLDYPEFPLHNNAAERGARRVVRKRDISFHTWSERGTRIRDAFMSLHQTAKKLKISFLDYLYDRNSGELRFKSIAQQVQEAYTQINTTY